MKKKRLVSAVAFAAAACSSSPPAGDAGHTDAGARDAGSDAGTDAGTDAGYTADAGCPCATDAGVCKVPSDFPDTQPGYIRDAICECVPNNTTVFCFFETSARCDDWACRPRKLQDGGLNVFADGGVECLCFV